MSLVERAMKNARGSGTRRPHNGREEYAEERYPSEQPRRQRRDYAAEEVAENYARRRPAQPAYEEPVYEDDAQDDLPPRRPAARRAAPARRQERDERRAPAMSRPGRREQAYREPDYGYEDDAYGDPYAERLDPPRFNRARRVEEFDEPAYHAGAAGTFTLDQNWLADQGFFTPQNKDKRLALELRAIKRRLLRRLHFYRPDGDRRRKTARERSQNTVLVTSSRPGEGKSFTAVNLALSLAIEDNINVILIDADVPRPRVFHHLGLQPGLGLTDRIVNPSIPTADLLRRERSYPLSVMCQGTERASTMEIFSRQEMSRFIDELSLRYPDSVIIFDAPPALATPEAVMLARHVDEILFVVEANKTPEPAVATAIDEILDSNSNLSLVLNQCLAPDAASHYGSYEDYHNHPGTTKSSGRRRARR